MFENSRFNLVPIKNFCKIKGGFAFKSNDYLDKGGIPIVRIGDLKNNLVNWNNCTNVPINYAEKYSNFLLQENDILVALTGATVGKIARVKLEQEKKALLNQRVGKFEITDSTKILDNYLYYVVLSENFRKKVEYIATGAGQPNISPYQIEDITIPLPETLEEQDQIVKILDDAADIVRLRQECINHTENLPTTIFYQMFGNPAINDKGWTVRKLGDLTTHVSSGATPKGGQSTYLNEGITFIRSQNVLMNRLDLSDVAFISQETHDKMTRSKVMKNDVLLNITGASIGRVAYYKGADDTANVNQHVCIIRPKLDEIIPEYLSYFISMPTYQEKIMMQQSGATRQAFNYQQIKKFDILLPSLPIQKEFAQIANEIDEYKQQQYKEIDYAKSLFQSLLQKAFTGELTARKYIGVS